MYRLNAVLRQERLPWEQIVRKTTEDIICSVRNCLDKILNYSHYTKRVEGASRDDVNASLGTVVKEFRDKVDELMHPYRHTHRLMYNRNVIQRVWNLQDSRRKAKNEAQGLVGGKQKGAGFFKANHTGDCAEPPTACDVENNLHHQACQLASDYTKAYYEDALQGLISNFSLYAVEGCLLSKLTSMFEVKPTLEAPKELNSCQSDDFMNPTYINTPTSDKSDDSDILIASSAMGRTTTYSQ
ncbi:hypothetical protein LX32DRAFT_665538 [Colletotrichum zoysiae]|uniref:Uncharacterized protein n=1 Tax=Colletotrichum zoysiae TaxID=1216348 RepID=A0AAD9LYY0_9PEZI|nr:hypothetical protein LX32DRAFT_665538 [Colletotrichum zoysiae]